MISFKLWLENEEIPAPGVLPIPPNHVRLYHYTKVNDTNDSTATAAANNLRKNGIDINQSKGSTYGEPNVVWASTVMPNRNKVFAEFSIDVNDPRWMMGKPNGLNPREYEKMGWDCYFNDSIAPQEIIAVHEPWHERYRYLLSNPELLIKAKNGDFDHLLNQPGYGYAIAMAKNK